MDSLGADTDHNDSKITAHVNFVSKNNLIFDFDYATGMGHSKLFFGVLDRNTRPVNLL